MMIIIIIRRGMRVSAVKRERERKTVDYAYGHRWIRLEEIEKVPESDDGP